MDSDGGTSDSICTPIKRFNQLHYHSSSQSPASLNRAVLNEHHNNKSNNPTTPLGQNQRNSKFSTPNTLQQQRKNGKFCLFNGVNTPPSRLPRIINPFEAALTERLHLPFALSPSLFHRPATPQHCSTQFEWTIDDVSSLNPANVEAHETQFISTTDPEVEARAQAAISTYFKEQLIVPSPIDCPLRNQKIILKDINGGTKRKRDGICQTELTFPPMLPKHIEDLLMPYFSYKQNQQQSPTTDGCDKRTTIDYDARDASLRRKLFETSINTSSSSGDNFDLKGLSPPPKTPENTKTNVRLLGGLQTTLNISPSDGNEEIGNGSFGSISPISKITTPSNLQNESKKKRTSLSTSSIYRSTPERSGGGASSSIIYRSCSSNSVNMSIDCSATGNCSNKECRSLVKRKSLSFNDTNMCQINDKDLTGDCDDEWPMSSSSQGSLHPSTPTRGQNRYANRKNLSHSFSFHSEEEFDDMESMIQSHQSLQHYAADKQEDDGEMSVMLSKTDSGFNEMEQSNQTQQVCNGGDVTMQMDCLTPRRTDV